jgi:nitroreductase
MMWAAESLGYNTAPMEGFDPEKLRLLLKLPISCEPIALLAIGRSKGEDKPDGGRFGRAHTVFEEEYPKPLIL